MGHHRHLFSVLTAVLTLCLGATSAAAAEPSAAAESTRLPVAVAERPLTLPRLILAPYVSFDVTHVGLTYMGTTVNETSFGMALGARFGIIDDLEVGATFAPIEFYPEPAYANPSLYLTYRFLRGPVEIGGTLGATVLTHQRLGPPTGAPASATIGGVINPGIPVHIHLGKPARLDTGAYVPITIFSVRTFPTTTTDVAVGLRIPVTFIYDIIEPVHIAVSTGFDIASFKTAGQSIYIPVGFTVGFVVPGAKGPIVDIDPFFQWPVLFEPGSPGPKALPGFFTTGVEATFYIYL